MGRPKILLIFPTIDIGDNYATTWAPYGPLYIAQALRASHGAKVLIYDQNRSNDHEWEEVLATHMEDVTCVGVSLMTGGGQIERGLELIAGVKRRRHDVPVVAGGPHVNVMAQQTLEHPDIDATLEGFGQFSMPAFVDYLQGSCNAECVPGLTLKRAGARLRGMPNRFEDRNMDLPVLDWEEADVEAYIREDALIGFRTLSYLSSQGCRWRCRYCYEQIHRRRFLYIRTEALVQDVLHLAETHHLDGIKFYDADFFLDLERAVRFASALAEKRLGLRWAASIHPLELIVGMRRFPGFLDLLRRSGCVRLLMGVESGSDRILRLINKGVTADQLKDAAESIARHGMIGNYCFIVGFPGETDAEIDQSFSLAMRLQLLVQPGRNDCLDYEIYH